MTLPMWLQVVAPGHLPASGGAGRRKGFDRHRCQRAWPSCLASMAHAAFDRQRAVQNLVLATADTRRGSFFTQLFDRDGTPFDAIAEVDPQAPGPCPDSWQGALVTGAGAATMVTCFPDAGLTAVADMPALDAMQVARFAMARLAAGEAMDPLLPLYVAPAFLGPSGPVSAVS